MIYAKIPASCIDLFEKTIRNAYLANEGEIDRQSIVRDFGFEVGSTGSFPTLLKEPGYFYYHLASEPSEDLGEELQTHGMKKLGLFSSVMVCSDFYERTRSLSGLELLVLLQLLHELEKDGRAYTSRVRLCRKFRVTFEVLESALSTLQNMGFVAPAQKDGAFAIPSDIGVRKLKAEHVSM